MQILNYVNFFKIRPNECENFVLTCVDFRFCAKIVELLPQANFREFDLLALPGAAKAVIDRDSRDTVFNAIDIGLDLHKIKRVIIVDHIDCGACGGSIAFADSNSEDMFHIQNLRDAWSIIKSRYPTIEVVLFYIDWNDMREVSPPEPGYTD